jgi:feruloyl esterase
MNARLFVAVALALPLAAADLADRCNSLKSGTVAAQVVAAGQFTPPQGPPNGAAAYKTLPEFCRVITTLRPTPDSQIQIEVWLPASSWNSDLQSVGNGAWAGSISYPAMATALAAGYATASTDTGHPGNNADFITGHPEKVVDFAYRAVHELTVAAKKFVADYYGKPLRYSIWNGCSTGGRQAFAEAQRYPNDYDGIIAGAPAFWASRLQGFQVWIAASAHKDEASYIPPAKYPAMHKAVLDQCDALDAVKDGVLEDPRKCKFDPAVLACKGADSNDCLTAAQVDFAKKMYAGAGVYPGIEPGAETGWAMLAPAKPSGLAIELYRDIVYKDAAWDYKTFDPSKDIPQAEKTIHTLMDSSDPNLKPFFSHNGKLLIYHGWADPGVPPMGTVNYYEAVTKAAPTEAKDDLRLFMVPGMGHCRGGDGTDTFDVAKLMQDWVATRKAPDRIEASHLTKGQVDKTRPLCAFPKVAVYTGSGSTNEAANFVCRAP